MKIRDLFPGYYQPTEEEFNILWDECIFSFDTNVLLHIYRYSTETRNRLFEILQKIKQRLWIPHQVAYESHKNRINVIYDQAKAYKDIRNILEKNLAIKTLKDQLFKNYKRHPLIDIKKIISIIEIADNTIETYLKDIEKSQPEYLIQDSPDFLQIDEIWNQLIDIIDDRVGEPYSDDIYKNKCKEAEQRFKNLIPPGYKDNDKEALDKYGDVILWFQLIDHAICKKSPIVFITDDNKEDWWLKHHGKTIGPRPELTQEMLTKAQVKFYMYQSDTFLERAENYLKLIQKPLIIEEARTVRLLNEEFSSLDRKKVRWEYTDFLRNKGCKSNEYAYWTNYIYLGLFGINASQMKEEWELIKGDSSIARNYILDKKIQAIVYCEKLTIELFFNDLKQAHDDAIAFTKKKFDLD